MLEFLQTGKALYVLAALGVLGIMSRWLTRSLYKRLIKETDKMALTKNKNLRLLKQKTESSYQMNQGIPKVKPYLERQMYDFRFMGITLHGWNLFSGQMTLWCFLAGGAAAFASYWLKTDPYRIVLYGSAGILTGLLTILADHAAGITEKRQQLFAALDNYLENTLIYRLDKERMGAVAWEGSGEAAREERENIRQLHPAGEKGPSPERTEASEEESHMTKRQRVRAERAKNQRNEELRRAGQEEPGAANARIGAASAGQEPHSKRGGVWALESERDKFKESEVEKGPQIPGADAGMEREAVSRRDVDYLKRSLEQIAASREREKSRHAGEDWLKDLSPDELKLIGEILQEYLT